MGSFAPKFDLLTLLSGGLAAKRYLFRSLFLFSLFLLLLLGFVGGSATAGAEVQKPAVSSAGPGLSFAIADFDGDLHPDLASVRAGQSDFSQTDYWIQLRLTAAGRQSIQVVAAIGGLQIAARDVNGDHAVDLVVISVQLKRPVAILLNDSHGGFTRAEPAAFLEAISESKTNWDRDSHPVAEVVGVPSQWRTEICTERQGLPCPRVLIDSIPLSSTGLFLNPFLVSHPGRAPPSEVSHL